MPYGVLLSGGLDSQLFPLSPRNTQPVAWKIRNALKPGGRSYTPFAVGLPGSPDLKAAQEVANHLGTVHHEIHFTVQEGLMPSAT